MYILLQGTPNKPFIYLGLLNRNNFIITSKTEGGVPLKIFGFLGVTINIYTRMLYKY